MDYFCKSHIALAMDSGLAKSTDGKVIIEKGTKSCEWSGCGTNIPDTYKMTYEKGEELTATSETSSQPQEEKPVPA